LRKIENNLLIHSPYAILPRSRGELREKLFYLSVTLCLRGQAA